MITIKQAEILTILAEASGPMAPIEMGRKAEYCNPRAAYDICRNARRGGLVNRVGVGVYGISLKGRRALSDYRKAEAKREADRKAAEEAARMAVPETIRNSVVRIVDGMHVRLARVPTLDGHAEAA